MAQLKNVVADSFTRYAGNVILDRAICDVRDMLKPSARMLMYSQLHITKNTSNKPFVKSARVVGDCLGRYYTHGDGSCYSTYMRMAKPYAMRYPLENCQGNSGTITNSGDEAHMRYTELRLSKLGDLLFSDIDKNTIQDWYDNFDETEKHPKILPSKGFYNIVNGSTGIGVSLSASIPQFNLKEINDALITLLYNPQEDIRIMPDFATGGILVNADEVATSLEKGYGSSCKIRSVIEFDQNQRAFIVKEIPYGVYTNTISEEIAKLLERQPDCGIDHINDGSGKKPDYIIYLTKKANPNKVLKLLYKETSLQSFFPINMNVLVENGTTPKTLSLKEMLQAHINHEIEVYTRGYEFDIKKIKNRLHIIDGLFICLANIDEVVHTIKGSTSTAAAAKSLQSKFLLDEEQTKAILDMKLSRLAHLEVQKLENEKTSLEKEFSRIEAILNDESLLKKEIEKGLRDVASKFGDARRTRILNIEGEDDDTVEEKAIQISLTNKNNLLVSEISSLYTQKRGGVGSKMKLDKDEYTTSTTAGQNTDTLILFSNKGNAYKCQLRELPLNEKTPIESIIKIQDSERVCTLLSLSKQNTTENVIFFTKKGYLKKSKVKEYNSGRALKAINLEDGDEIISVLPMNDEKVGMLTARGHFVMCETKPITAIGRIAKGVKGINLNDGDYLVSAQIIPPDTRQLLTITSNGYTKRTNISEVSVTNRGTKGVVLHKLKEDGDMMIDFIPIINETSVVIISSKAQLKTKVDEIPSLSKGAIGTKAIKITNNARVIGISKN